MMTMISSPLNRTEPFEAGSARASLSQADLPTSTKTRDSQAQVAATAGPVPAGVQPLSDGD